MLLFVSLGANLGDRQANIEKAVRALGERIGAPAGCSRFIETPPVGFRSDHLFLNAVAAFHTDLAPDELLRRTQQIERELGRAAKSRDGVYEDRLIDIDLLLMGDTVVCRPDLQLPHPHLERRRFVLEPLHELAPDLRHPVSGKTVAELLRALNRADIRRLSAAGCAAALPAVNRLLPQLSASAPPLSAAALQRLVANPHSRLLLARDEAGHIQGMATLCLCASPTGLKAWVEDVVVDAACRGRGYARQLLDALRREAAACGAKSVNLTSRPSRVAANALYASAGYERRDTNVYRLRGSLS